MEMATRLMHPNSPQRRQDTSRPQGTVPDRRTHGMGKARRSLGRPHWTGLGPTGPGWARSYLDRDRRGRNRDRCGLEKYWSVPKTSPQRTPGRSQGIRASSRPAITPLRDSAQSNSVSEGAGRRTARGILQAGQHTLIRQCPKQLSLRRGRQMVIAGPGTEDREHGGHPGRARASIVAANTVGATRQVAVLGTPDHGHITFPQLQ